MKYKLTDKDMGTIVNILNENKLSDMRAYTREHGMAAMDKVAEYMICRSILEAAMMSILEAREKCPMETREAAIARTSHSVNEVAKAAAESLLESLDGVDIDDMRSIASEFVEGEWTETNAIKVDDLPDEIAQEVAKAAGMSIDELREADLRVGVAKLDDDGEMEMLSASESKEIVSRMPMESCERKYINMRSGEIIDLDEAAAEEREAESLDDIISKMDAARKEL